MRISEAIEKAIQELINTKHLYQSVTVDFEPCVRAEAHEFFLRRQRGDLPSKAESENTIKQGLLTELDAKDWRFDLDKRVNLEFDFSLPPISLLCSFCDEVEAFNLWGEASLRQTISLGKLGQQVFWFPLQCQRCKEAVIVLLVRRIGRKITLIGRSEFEKVSVPRFIPKGSTRLLLASDHCLSKQPDSAGAISPENAD
jgi:hypothetical protein